MKKLYVGNLSYETTEDKLRALFAECGEIASCVIIRDKQDNSSKGFGFVEMASDAGGDEAIKKLDGADCNGRKLKVNVARDKNDSAGGGRSGARW